MQGCRAGQVAKQVTDREIVYMMISGTESKSKTPSTRVCMVERLRTKAGGRTSIEEPSQAITEDGVPARTDAEADKIKEKNRYRVDRCKSTDDKETTNVEIQQLAEPSYALGK